MQSAAVEEVGKFRTVSGGEHDRVDNLLPAIGSQAALRSETAEHLTVVDAALFKGRAVAAVAENRDRSLEQHPADRPARPRRLTGAPAVLPDQSGLPRRAAIPAITAGSTQ